mmetsp:Transcript_28778/g.65849  ORF Transcript_28778/g.65849 Transcript_28778/m.65849 type:complete len:575 (-) Transcript_28778:637-2361(-)
MRSGMLARIASPPSERGGISRNLAESSVLRDSDDNKEELHLLRAEVKRLRNGLQEIAADNGTVMDLPSSTRSEKNPEEETHPLRSEMAGLVRDGDDMRRKVRRLTRELEGERETVRSLRIREEEVRSLRRSLEASEEEASNLRRAAAAAGGVGEEWVAWRRVIVAVMDAELRSEGKLLLGDSGSLPPEVSSVTRSIRSLKAQLGTSERALLETTDELEKAKKDVSSLKKSLTEAIAMKNVGDRKTSSLQDEMERVKIRHKSDLLVAEKHEKIARRETEGLADLLETYKEKEKHGAKFGSSPVVDAMKSRLSAAQKEVEELRKDIELGKEELNKALQEGKDGRAEHEKVVEKFHKLKAALIAEREKAEKAQERTVLAETLAGKGFFNKNTTRVLHLQDNPSSQALREKYLAEIASLKKEIESLRNRPAADAINTPGSNRSLISSSSSSGKNNGDLDAQKLHARLRQQFKDQISQYREGVYLITGWRVEMFKDADRPRFKVRHMYAEREDDHLMFVWPEVGPGEEVTMLDLMESDLARALSKNEAFAYITKFRSYPAFMAALALNLFENQTQITFS